MILCAECGTEFEPKRSDQKYCCKPCKQRDYRRRRDDATADVPVSVPRALIDEIDSDPAKFITDLLREKLYP